MTDRVAITYTDNSLKPAAITLAKKLKLQLTTSHDSTFEFLLVLTPERLQLQQTSDNAPGPIYVDFVSGKAQHRRLYGGGRGQLIAKACGVKSNSPLTVLDLTAGLGRDAFVLACLGCHVTMLERSPIVAALLADGLSRLQASSLSNIQLSLIQADAIDYLQGLQQTPDVIYIDPMFPARTKTALVKKEMRIFQSLLDEQDNATYLLQAAIGKAKRIVVKRPRTAPQLTQTKPAIVYQGKSSRFDVYL